MKKSQFSEEQKIGLLKQVRAGRTVVRRTAGPSYCAAGVDGPLAVALSHLRNWRQTIRQYWNGIVSYFDSRLTQGASNSLSAALAVSETSSTCAPSLTGTPASLTSIPPPFYPLKTAKSNKS
jgi:hypothetical protein